MLTMERPGVEAAAHDTFSYWCQWFATNPATGAAYSLGGAAALTPRLAMRWARQRGQDIGPQLNPPGSWVIDGWLQDERELAKALYQLTVGITYDLTVYEESAEYALTIRPIAIPPITDPANGGGSC
ncbi:MULTISPECIES: hypothetical protein [Streptacidiphilus]|uniref:Uncharacterized protein n=1 Tax=Streptacidiphilus cavernicola TaxID=3342716 RepID=A0ABV6UW63_9ACTN|nr:hypothetical protein [Streptacidiphilus jeojiense]